MLQPGQLGGQGLVGLHQLRDLLGLPGDLAILRRQPPILLAHEHDQLVSRELLRHRHTKI